MDYRIFIIAQDWSEVWLHVQNRLEHDSKAATRDIAFSPWEFGAYADVAVEAEVFHQLQTVCASCAQDILIIERQQLDQPYRLACFDMDSTLINAECIVELAREHGVMEEVDHITEEAMAGNLDFRQSFEKRLSLLAGLPKLALDRVAQRIELSPGMIEMVRGLKSKDIKLAIFSGGFDFVANRIAEKYGFDYVHTNRLEIENDALSGQYVGEIIDAEAKKKYLQYYCQHLNIPTELAIAVGDGANDIPMLQTAGLSIGFRAKAKVVSVADANLKASGLDVIPYLLTV